MDRRITGGLAWAGLLLVLAVPSADLISQQFAPDTALTVNPRDVAKPKPVAEGVKPSTPAKVVPKPAPVAAVVPAVKSGKPMPSYISDGKADETIKDLAVVPPASKPVPTRVIPGPAPVAVSEEGPKVIISAPASKTPVTVPAPGAAQVASVDVNPMVVAPVPMPASMRPAKALPRAPDQTYTGAITPLNQSGYEPDDVVTADELADWESGPLEEFLAKRRNTGEAQPRPRDYDQDGFFLSDGPNGQGGADEPVFPFAYN